MRGLHGREGRREAGPQRLQDGAPGGQGAPGVVGLRGAQGRGQRDPQGVVQARRGHPLRHRDGHGAPSVSHDGLRLPEHNRQGGPLPVGRGRGARAGLPPGMRGRREQRHRAVPRVRRRPRRPHDRVRGRGQGGGHGHARRDHDQGHHWDIPRDEVALLPGRLRADRPGVLDIGGAGLPGHRPGARAPQVPGPGGVCGGHRRQRRGRLRVPVEDRGHNPSDRERTRGGIREGAGTHNVQGRRDGREPLRPRGQGRGGDRQVQGAGHP